MDPMDHAEGTKSQYGVLKLQQSPLDSATSSGGQHFSFANPVYEPSNNSTGPTYKVEDVVVRIRSSTSSGTYRRANTTKVWAAIKSKSSCSF